MIHSPGMWVFVLAPLILSAILLWHFPQYRHIRWRSLLSYAIIMGLLIWGTLQFVARVAGGKVIHSEVAVILWFTISWRLAWTLWTCTFGHCGQRWVKRGHRFGRFAPLVVRGIPTARAIATTFVFIPLFLSTVLTHRFKIADGDNPRSLFSLPYETIRIPTSDGLVLEGWFVPQAGADRTMVICHGAGANKGNFIWFLWPFADKGYNIVLFDFRAHGRSGGRTTTYGIRERLDVVAVVDWLKRERPTCARQIVGLGSSQGSLEQFNKFCSGFR